MDKWTAIEPVKLYDKASSTAASVLSRLSGNAPSRAIFIGPLPPELHLLILDYLPLYDLPAIARSSRAFSRLVRDEKLWERKWKALKIEKYALQEVLNELQNEEEHKPPPPRPGHFAVEEESDLATFTVGGDDEFGDFTEAPPTQSTTGTATETFGQFVNTFNNVALDSQSAVPYITAFPSHHTFRSKFVKAHKAFVGLLPKVVTPPELALSHLFPSPAKSLYKGRVLHLLALFLSPAIEPTRIWSAQKDALNSSIRTFNASLVTAFDTSEEKGEDEGMKEAAWASWEVWDGQGEWEMGKTWMEKRDVFFDSDRWDPLRNLTNNTLHLDPMVVFMTNTMESVRKEGSFAIRIFPPSADILLAVTRRVAADVIGEYITPLLSRAREISIPTYLNATPATFKQAWRLVDSIMDVANPPPEAVITRTQAEDVIFRMFEMFMEDYLTEEISSTKKTLDTACDTWDRKVASHTGLYSPNAPHFLKNPAQVKRNVLASFADVLLLPVQVAATGGTAVAKGISKLTPQQRADKNKPEANGYRTPLADKDDPTAFDLTMADIDNPNEHDQDHDTHPHPTPVPAHVVNGSRASLSLVGSGPGSRSGTPVPGPRPSTPLPSSFDRLELLLSLDVALELIHAVRDSLARVQTFQAYPGTYGYRVRDTFDQLFVLLLQAMGDRHICPAFEKAEEQMKTYKADEHEISTSVAPLLQFFELVHLADTIQSMVQVFFDKELSAHIDRTDFMNDVIREKKRFENSLDDAVASGMNAGTEVLMNQVEHIIWSRTGPREYYPPEGPPLELGPTEGCREAIQCLEMHCKLLKGSTSKDVLEVFYQEVGIRLHGIIQKHLKRQIISLEGGFQVIADLNAYYSFIASLRVQQITQDFSNLKMLGHVFIVSDAKDLAQIVRDVTRYGGSFRPEDVYEFIQRRADWKKIEKTVDKTMYNLSFKDDCIIA
ncbi:hypothetical protein DACRYDRAFT_89279 [Dacryopinax primogenitus]|uniref:F-box domain-containing protein n=1 Tax=Dacryopinax primogenitus (strain DJM 731) TaxID=1858805 RepID=M5FUZ9_DACPD|nr:uncharacterized protein DACRYDRAFT_89279 [Dacryopinax primogenitus]EJU01596.1 hypothetical protein DACRYDRAFT_89279 [Dacryopinax primogenitus]